MIQVLSGSQSINNIAAQDFEDDGELYQSQLNRIIRHFLAGSYPTYGSDCPIFELQKNYDISAIVVDEPDCAISVLQKNHNISAILAQIEDEKAAILALQRARKIGQRSAVIKASHISLDHDAHEKAQAGPAEDTAPISQTSQVKGGKRAAAGNKEEKPALRQSLRLRPKNNATMSSSQLTVAVRNSWIKEGGEKKRRRVA